MPFPNTFEGACINLSAATPVFKHAESDAGPSSRVPPGRGRVTPVGPTTPSPQHTQPPGRSSPKTRFDKRLTGEEEEMGKSCLGSAVAVQQTGPSLLAFDFICFTVISNGELLCNPNSDSLWRSR